MRSPRPRTISLKRKRKSATVVLVLTASVGQAPARPSDSTGLEPGSSAPSSSISATVAASGWLRVRKAAIQQAEQPVECRLIAAVRGCGQQDQMTVVAFGEALEQFEALLPALVSADAGMRLVHDHKRRTR